MASTERLLVADTGPLLALARVDGLEWLTCGFSEVLVPRIVWKESQHHPVREDAQMLRKAIEKHAAFSLCASAAHPRLAGFPLGAGERAAISVALQRNARVLLGDRATISTARIAEVPLIGTLGGL